jgi:hypothetical protein
MRIVTGLCAVLLAALALPSAARADAVYALELSFSAVVVTDGALAKQKVTNEALVNLARGRAVDAPVPGNEVMALVFDCATGEGSLVVFDGLAGSVLVTWATGDAEDLLLAPNGGAFALDLDVAEVGADENGIDDGYLVVTAQFKPGPMNCPSGIKASVSGALDVTVTDDVGTDSLTAVLLKGKAGFSSDPIDQIP